MPRPKETFKDIWDGIREASINDPKCTINVPSWELLGMPHQALFMSLMMEQSSSVMLMVTQHHASCFEHGIPTQN